MPQVNVILHILSHDVAEIIILCFYVKF
jgi:hypothetical protein